MFHTFAWVSEILELKNIKGSIGKRIFDCSQRSTEITLLLTDWPLTTCSWAGISTGMARGTDTLWLSSELFFTRHLPEVIENMPTPTTARAFVGYLSFFRGKVRVSRFTQKRFGSKNVLKPTLDMKQQVFPRNKLKNKKSQFTQWINGWNRINSYRILA